MNFTDALKLARQKRCAITRDDFRVNNPRDDTYIQHGMDNVFFITTHDGRDGSIWRHEMIWSVADLLHEGYEIDENHPYSYLRDRIDKIKPLKERLVNEQGHLLKGSSINKQGHNEAPITPKPNIKPPAQRLTPAQRLRKNLEDYEKYDNH